MDPVTLQLALGLAAQGLRAVADFQDRAAKGHVTLDECRAMADKLGMNADSLIAEAEAKIAARTP